jgi:hypothetical protein
VLSRRIVLHDVFTLMPGPVCVACGLFFKNRRNGVVIEERMPDGAGGWKSYKLWGADLKECEGCGTQIVVGFGIRPIAEHYEPGYAETVRRLTPLVRVDDCGIGPFNADRALEKKKARS